MVFICFQTTMNSVLGTVGKILTALFSFFPKRVVKITILDLRPVSNERPGNFTV